MDAYKLSTLWKTAFPDNATDHIEQRQRIVQAYERFHERVAHLLQQIQKELPNLTLHDITHVDTLWEVASQIAGPSYPFNPAEALVLGGAFLLHDAAHCRAAYSGGLDEIRKLAEWRDASARHNLDPEMLNPGSDDFQAVLFDTLRVLHPQQAKNAGLCQMERYRRRRIPLPGWRTTQRLWRPDRSNCRKSLVSSAPAGKFRQRPQDCSRLPRSRQLDSRSAQTGGPAARCGRLSPRRQARPAIPDAAQSADRKFRQCIGSFSQKSTKSHAMLGAKNCSSQAVLSAPTSKRPGGKPTTPPALADRELSAADGLLRDFRIQRLAAREVAGVRSPESFAKHVQPKGLASGRYFAAYQQHPVCRRAFRR